MTTCSLIILSLMAYVGVLRLCATSPARVRFIATESKKNSKPTDPKYSTENMFPSYHSKTIPMYQDVSQMTQAANGPSWMKFTRPLTEKKAPVGRLALETRVEKASKMTLKSKRNAMNGHQPTVGNISYSDALSTDKRQLHDRRDRVMNSMKTKLNQTKSVHDVKTNRRVWGTRITKQKVKRSIEGETHFNGTLLRYDYFRTFDPYMNISVHRKLFSRSDLHNNRILNRTGANNAERNVRHQHDVIFRQKRRGKEH